MRKMFVYCPCCCSIESVRLAFGVEHFFQAYQCVDYGSFDKEFLKKISFLLDDEGLYSLNFIGVNDSFDGLNTKDESVYRNELMKIVYEFTEAPFIKELYENENLDIFGIIFYPDQNKFKVL